MNNSSTSLIKDVKISLIQFLKYYATKTDIKEEEKNLVVCPNIGMVGLNTEQQFEHSLTVPEAPTTIEDGEAVDITYYLKVEISRIKSNRMKVEVRHK